MNNWEDFLKRLPRILLDGFLRGLLMAVFIGSIILLTFTCE